jgi:hypothetical protein
VPKQREGVIDMKNVLKFGFLLSSLTVPQNLIASSSTSKSLNSKDSITKISRATTTTESLERLNNFNINNQIQSIHKVMDNSKTENKDKYDKISDILGGFSQLSLVKSFYKGKTDKQKFLHLLATRKIWKGGRTLLHKSLFDKLAEQLITSEVRNREEYEERSRKRELIRDTITNHTWNQTACSAHDQVESHTHWKILNEMKRELAYLEEIAWKRAWAQVQDHFVSNSTNIDYVSAFEAGRFDEVLRLPIYYALSIFYMESLKILFSEDFQNRLLNFKVEGIKESLYRISGTPY